MNKFLKITDNKVDFLGKYEIPEYWWSRKHEYAFCSDFVKENEIVLDAGCGIEHPFKFYLADKKNKVYAVDKDAEILNINNKKINVVLNLDLVDLTSQIQEKTFDKIFCISVLEHCKYQVPFILEQFEKLLKEDGIIVITFDVPLMTVQEFLQYLENTNLQMVGDKDFEMSKDDLTNYSEGLKVFATVLKKKNIEIASQEIKPLIPTETK